MKDSRRADRPASTRDAGVRSTHVVSSGALLGLAIAGVTVGLTLCPARVHVQPSILLTRTISLYAVVYAELCCAVLGVAAVVGWGIQRRRREVLRSREWRVWCAGTAITVVIWLQGSCWLIGQPNVWRSIFTDIGGPYAVVEALLLLPVSALLSIPLVAVATARWTRHRYTRLAAAGSLIVLFIACTPLLDFARSWCLRKSKRDQNHGVKIRRDSGSSSSAVRGVVLVVIDTLRADHVSCLGSTRVRTPIMDRLADTGVLFSKAISQGPWTHPSTGSLMTSQYPSVHGVGMPKRALASNVPTLAEVLSAAGWETSAFVNNGILGSEFGFDRGFNYYEMPCEVPPSALDTKSSAAYVIRTAWPLGLLRMPPQAVARLRWETPSADRRAVDGAAAWLRAQDSAPFFVWVHLMAVHDYMDYRAVLVGEAGRHLPIQPLEGVARSPDQFRTVRSDFVHTSDEDLADLHPGYDANVVFDDALIVVLIEALRDIGALQDTLFIVVADHGEEFEEHGNTGHGQSLYDELIHVPLIMSCPALLPKRLRVTQQVRLIDVMPTVLELAGITLDSPMAGRSLIELTKGEACARRIAFSEFDDTRTLEAARSVDRKLIVHTDHTLDSEAGDEDIACLEPHDDGQGKSEDPAIELYDLVKDPGEQRNIAEGSHSDVASLSNLYVGWRSEVAQKQKTVAASRTNVDADLRDRMAALGYVMDADGSIRHQGRDRQ